MADTGPAGQRMAELPTLPDELVEAMLSWYHEMHRDLPWRRTRDPYAILVSEIMLQQTRVETVLGRYESFLARFPTVADLAAAPLDDVLAEWSGLGYYRRPRALHALAQTVVEHHGGNIPATLEELLALPGLGPYAAAAVGSLAFGIPALSVDGNVGRILCRLAGIEDDPRRAPVRRRLEGLVADAMQVHPPGELNQAIMEIGARVCVSRLPRCDECPAAQYCEAHALGFLGRHAGLPRARATDGQAGGRAGRPVWVLRLAVRGALRAVAVFGGNHPRRLARHDGRRDRPATGRYRR